ncbi:ABC-three component system middle component 4 [Stutzerimonas nitrititolerans]|uniref:ABC-three component system middle component 4 n=1 Tax=Stutzerimonas nitrititolerans TaxID=2482751 RepID=UPI0028A875B3|nr:ABC-three component system middle component 4 [Stutzerimonas nitrititolerans]
MSQALPYLLIDDDFTLNYSLVALILYKLGLSTKKNAVLDFEKLQIFLYLTKNPSKINPILKLAGKDFSPINPQYTYTIESLSTNVDMLFDRSKLKVLLKELAARGMLICENQKSNSPLKYVLSESGKVYVESLIYPTVKDSKSDPQESSSKAASQCYFLSVAEVIDSLYTLQAQTTSKLNSYLNILFKRT